MPLVPPDHARTIDLVAAAPELLEEVRQYLDERRLLGTQLVVDGPAYVGVSVEASILVQRHRNSDHVRAEVATRVREYLDPLLGGPDGLGWPFGRDSLPLGDAIGGAVGARRGVRAGRDALPGRHPDWPIARRGQKITVADDVLLLSYEHVVTVSNR